MGESYPYQALLESAEEDAGLGVISRFPLQDHSWFLVGNTPRDAQWVTLNVRMHGIELLNVHLAKNWITVYLDKSRDYFESQNSVREEQAREISAFAHTHSPLVVAGDLNTSDTTRTYEILRAELDDSFRDKGWGLGATFSSVWFPYGRIPVPPRILRLDYILHSHELYTVESYVGKADTQSDHLPVMVDLQELELVTGYTLRLK